MQTTLCKTDREEIKKCLEALENKEYWRNDGKTDLPLVFDLAFIALKKIASQEVHPSGDHTLLSNLTNYSWERLLSMRDAAHDRFFLLDDSVKRDELEAVYKLLEAEIERRLLAIGKEK
ncbi:hypothetical protein [Pontibacter beigongshangensis]|uniref:hypothetical protein n=1 Tax=Pontibacter beigongshangensis TaxID=2574733 RepID=UPI00164F7021|nr:hypothetical protein [Pontibacter beigongshangensis]